MRPYQTVKDAEKRKAEEERKKYLQTLSKIYQDLEGVMDKWVASVSAGEGWTNNSMPHQIIIPADGARNYVNDLNTPPSDAGIVGLHSLGLHAKVVAAPCSDNSFKKVVVAVALYPYKEYFDYNTISPKGQSKKVGCDDGKASSSEETDS